MLPALINHYSVATEDTNSEIFKLLKHLRLHVLISLNPDGHWMSREAASTNPKGMFLTFDSFQASLSCAASHYEKNQKDMFAGCVDATITTTLI